MGIRIIIMLIVLSTALLHSSAECQPSPRTTTDSSKQAKEKGSEKSGKKSESLNEHQTIIDSAQLKADLAKKLVQKKVEDWVASLQLNDKPKETRLTEVISIHLKAIDDWVTAHPFTTVPAGINPINGRPLNEVDRHVIANSAIPPSVHKNLMDGLRKDLNQAQVDSILDRYTIGKVAFTMKAYREIVPGITAIEDSTILSFMKQAREQAVDYSGMKQVSAIFEIYKTKAEQYLNQNGRSWREMYRNYTEMLKAKKLLQFPNLSIRC